jgi:alkylhydroperoxidase family enzyme
LARSIHTALAAKLGVPPDIVKAIGTGASVRDPKLAALRRFTELLTIGRGQIAKAEVESFVSAGYDRTAIVAVAFGVAVKTFANTLAHLAQTPVDGPFAATLTQLQA